MTKKSDNVTEEQARKRQQARAKLDKARRRKRRITVVIAIGLVGAGSWYYYSSQEPVEEAEVEEVSYTTVPVERGDIKVAFDTEGTSVVETTEIAFETSGQLTEVHVQVGDEITEGQLLGKLDSYELSQKVTQASSSYSSSVNNLTTAETNELQGYRDDIDDAKTNLEEQKVLYDINMATAQDTHDEAIDDEQDKLQDIRDMDPEQRAEGSVAKQKEEIEEVKVAQANKLEQTRISEQEKVDQAEQAVEDAQEKYDNFVANIPQLENNVTSSAASLGIAQDNLHSATLYSNTSGTVVAVNTDVGESTGQDAFVVVASNSLPKVEVYADETEALKITKDMPAEVEFDIYDHPLQAVVEFVSPIATTDNSGWNTYQVLLRFADTDQKILDGLIGDVEFITKEVPDVLIIPVEAVHNEGTTSYVTVVDGLSEEERAVETGFTDGDEVEVMSGLAVGEVVKVPER